MSIAASGLTWGEGIRVVGKTGWVSDPQGGTFWTNEAGQWMSHPLASQSNGLWPLPDGRVVGAIIRERRVGLWDGKDFAHYADLSKVATGPLGDMVGDAKGGLYVDDVGYAAHLGDEPRPGRLIYVEPGGGAAHVAADSVLFPNGLAIIDGGHTLVLAETSNQRLLSFDMREDGTLGDRRVYADLAVLLGPDAQPDGIAAAADGGVWVATLGRHQVVRVQDGVVVHRIDLSDGVPVACFESADGTLWVTVADPGGLPFMEAVVKKVVTSTIQYFTRDDVQREGAGR